MNEEILDLKFYSKTQKIIISTGSKKLLVWDLFLQKCISEIKTNKKYLSFDIIEGSNQFFGAAEGEREVHMWVINNFGMALNQETFVPFHSAIREKLQNQKYAYLIHPKGLGNDLNVTSDIDHQLIKEVSGIIDQDKKLTRDKSKFKLEQEIKWKQLNLIDNHELHNKLQEINFEEESNDLPFFLDFGDNILEQIKRETEGTLEEKKGTRRVIRKYNREEITKQRGNELDLYIQKAASVNYQMIMKGGDKKDIEIEEFESIYKFLVDSSAKEIDLYFKTTHLSEEVVRTLLAFCDYVSNKRERYAFNVSLIRNLMNVLYDKDFKEKKKLKLYLTRLHEKIQKNVEGFFEDYVEIQGVLENFIQMQEINN